MKKLTLLIATMFYVIAASAKTLIVYYSYTNNVHRICNELREQTGADILRIQPAEEGIDYAANNYAIGSAQVQAIRDNPDDAESYPEIKPTGISLDQYDVIIIGAPLWWNNMAAPLQTFLFKNGASMAGKKIGLIVSSASSGISGVEADAKRLIPGGVFLPPSLWIRSSQVSNSRSLVSSWLTRINYSVVSGTAETDAGIRQSSNIYNINGTRAKSEDLAAVPSGLYIVNGRKLTVK